MGFSSVQQVQRCLREWENAPNSPMTLQRLTTEEYGASDNYQLISSPQLPLTSSGPRTAPMVAFNPTTPPLLSTQQSTRSPSPSLSPQSARKRKASPSNSDRLKLTCHHGPVDSHEVQSSLKSIPDGPSQLEVYTRDEQAHELRALGFLRGAYRRADHSVNNGRGRCRKSTRSRAGPRATKGVHVEGSSGAAWSQGGSGSGRTSRPLSGSEPTEIEESTASKAVEKREGSDGSRSGGEAT